ncbi:MAG: hypothetical protein KI785_06365 [Devosiaceae bacterium]|nr:hypothetical protein [Devosiaceae bacterium MH13]
MLKRIALFIVAHMAFFAVAAAIVAASTTSADAQTDNPYDLEYTVRGETPLLAGPDAGAAQVGVVAAGTQDIRLRWCRPEFPFERWMFGGSRAQRDLLDERVCEVEAAGAVGFVSGRALNLQ